MQKRKSQLIWGISTRKDGNMSFKYGPAEAAIQNSKKFFKKKSLDFQKSVFMTVPKKINTIKFITRDYPKPVKADALVTSKKKITLVMLSADCPGIIIFDKFNNILLFAHAGRPQVVNRIIDKITKYLKIKFKTDCGKSTVLITPGICKKCYKFKKNRLKKIQQDINAYPPLSSYVYKQSNYYHIDLKGLIIRELKLKGFKNIKTSTKCTVHSKKYFSHYLSIKNSLPEQRHMVYTTMK